MDYRTMAQEVERKCEGNCEPCIGIVRAVDVVDWCQFDYCQAAIDEDRSRGLTVVEKLPSESASTDHFGHSASTDHFPPTPAQPQSRVQWESKRRPK